MSVYVRDYSYCCLCEVFQHISRLTDPGGGGVCRDSEWCAKAAAERDLRWAEVVVEMAALTEKAPTYSASDKADLNRKHYQEKTKPKRAAQREAKRAVALKAPPRRCALEGCPFLISEEKSMQAKFCSARCRNIAKRDRRVLRAAWSPPLHNG